MHNFYSFLSDRSFVVKTYHRASKWLLNFKKRTMYCVVQDWYRLPIWPLPCFVLPCNYNFEVWKLVAVLSEKYLVVVVCSQVHVTGFPTFALVCIPHPHVALLGKLEILGVSSSTRFCPRCLFSAERKSRVNSAIAKCQDTLVCTELRGGCRRFPTGAAVLDISETIYMCNLWEHALW